MEPSFDTQLKNSPTFSSLVLKVESNGQGICLNSEAIQKNREAIQKNREAIQKNREAIQKNREAIIENRAAILENRDGIHENGLKIDVLESKIDQVLEMTTYLVQKSESHESFRGRITSNEEGIATLSLAVRSHIADTKKHRS